MPRTFIRDFGASLNLNNTNSSVSVAGTTPTVTSGLTICAWVNLNGFISKQVASSALRIIRTNDDNIDVFLRQTTGVIEVKLNTTQGSGIRATAGEQYLSPHKWHFVVVQYTAQAISHNLQVFIDGVEVGYADRDGTNISCNNTWILGDLGTSSVLGLVDSVYVYNTAFTAAQRSNAYLRSIFPSTNQVFSYQFNEGSGTSATDGSGNGKTGTIANASYSTQAISVPRTTVSRRPAATKLLGSFELSPDVDSHNGVAADGTYIYTFGNSAIYKWDLNWNLVASNLTASTPTGAQHLGDGTAYGGKLYIATENYTNFSTWDHQRIAVFNTSDLSFVAIHDISAQAREVSGLAIDAPNDLIYISSYVSSDSVAMYKLSDFSFIGLRSLKPALALTQCVTFKDGFLYFGESTTQSIHKYDASTGIEVGPTIRVSKTDQEGVDYTTNVMYALDEQGTFERVWKLYQFPARQTLNGNIVFNPDFERYPPFTAATNTDDRWIDGTAAGTNYGDFMYGWCLNNGNNGSTAQFDQAQFHSGTTSMKVSNAVGVNTEVNPFRTDDNAGHLKSSFPVLPSTSYTFTYWQKTSLTSGDSNDGAYMALRTFTRDGSNGSTTSGTKVKTTTGWTQRTITFTTAATDFFVAPSMRITGATGAATLLMDAWFDDLVIKPTTTVARTIVT